MPEISIIVPVYKVEQFLPGCIESILAQTFTDFELLLIDDGSPDGSGIICDEYAEKDSRVRVIHKENGGVSSARNAGIDQANGNYIMFCDGDDYTEPTWAERLYATVSGGDAVIGVCGCFLVRNDADPKTPRLPDTDPLIPFSRYYDLRLASLDQFVWNKIFVKKHLDDAGLRFDENMPYAEDSIFVMNYLRPLNGMIGVSNECLYNYRNNPQSVSYRYIPELWNCYLRVFEEREAFFNRFGVDFTQNLTHYANILLMCCVRSINNYLSEKSPLTDAQKFRKLRKIVKSRFFSTAVEHAEFRNCSETEIAAFRTKNAEKIFFCALQSTEKGSNSKIFHLGKPKKSKFTQFAYEFHSTLSEGGLKGLCKRGLAKVARTFYTVWYKLRYRKPVVIFESVPNLSDNTKAVYDEMLRRGLNEKYHFVWMCWKDESRKLDDKNCEALDFKAEDVRKSAKTNLFLEKAKCLVCCNRFLKARRPDAKVYYLTHGSPIKATRSYYTIPDYIDYCISPAEGMNGIISYQFNFAQERIVPLGFPRNDAFAGKPVDLNGILKTDYSKIVVWYPTFRQHRANASLTNSKNALPIIHDEASAIRLNRYAVETNTLIILKPHFVQDISYVKDLNLSNILFIGDSFFTEHGISSYEFLESCDALLTDYSSVYFDYLLADKPIGAVWEDIAEYRENPGFALDLDHYLAGAEKIYTIDDLEKFIGNVASGTDNLAKERRTVCEEVNYSYDGKNAERVVDFIIKNSNL